jgi:hypothetical protein
MSIPQPLLKSSKTPTADDETDTEWIITSASVHSDDKKDEKSPVQVVGISPPVETPSVMAGTKKSECVTTSVVSDVETKKSKCVTPIEIKSLDVVAIEKSLDEHLKETQLKVGFKTLIKFSNYSVRLTIFSVPPTHVCCRFLGRQYPYNWMKSWDVTRRLF